MASENEYKDVASLGRRLTNLREGDGYALGVETETGVLDVPGTAEALGLSAPQDMDDLLQNGRGAEVRAVIEAAERSPEKAIVVASDNATFGPLVTRPEKIICVGFNYQQHAEETDTEVGDVPALFNKWNSTLNYDGGTIELPTRVSSWFDYETELVIVFGRTCHNVSEDDALDYVAGYAVGNDFSARDLQTATPQIMLGKNCDGFGPLGPWMATADKVPDPNALALTTYVNGTLRQDWNTNDMIFNCKQLISFVSGLWTIKPGDIMYTGTPQGVIFGEKRPPEERDWLKAGDEVVSEIEGLGTLTVTLTD